MKYKAISIEFMNGNSIVIDKNWDDYDYVKDFIVIKYKRAWIAMYKASEIFSLVLIPEKED